MSQWMSQEVVFSELWIFCKGDRRIFEGFSHCKHWLTLLPWACVPCGKMRPLVLSILQISSLELRMKHIKNMFTSQNYSMDPFRSHEKLLGIQVSSIEFVNVRWANVFQKNHRWWHGRCHNPPTGAIAAISSDDTSGKALASFPGGAHHDQRPRSPLAPEGLGMMQPWDILQGL